MKMLTSLLPLALLAACGPGENDPGPGGVTAGEARALDDAAAMLEERRLPDAALAPTAESSVEASGTASAVVQPSTEATNATSP